MRSKEPSSSTFNPEANHSLPEGFDLGSDSSPLENLSFAEDPDNEDYAWALHNSDFRKQHSGLVVAVHQRVLWGVGKNHLAAWKDASTKPNCPPQEDLTFVAIP